MPDERLVTISSATLFHFTNSIGHLESILENNFLPHYSLEAWSHVLPKVERLAFPLVSFCDIPLSQTRQHLSYYGRYGIGLSKEWGRRKGVCPVTYAYHGAPTADLAGKALSEVLSLENAESAAEDELWDTVFRLLEYIKPYEGPLVRGDTTYESVRFYDEREWRFVPDIDDCAPHYYGLTEDQFNHSETRQQANRQVQANCVLEFIPADVKYLIVASESEVLPFIRTVEDLKGSKYSLDDVRKLTTRIISADQIEIDF